MELTGKCKEEFEKWFKEEHVKWMSSTHYFYNALSSSMKYGVYVDFFNTLRYEGITFFDHVFNKFYNIRIELQTHNDLVKQTIEKANELFNERS